MSNTPPPSGDDARATPSGVPERSPSPRLDLDAAQKKTDAESSATPTTTPGQAASSDGDDNFASWARPAENRDAGRADASRPAASASTGEQATPTSPVASPASTNTASGSTSSGSTTSASTTAASTNSDAGPRTTPNAETTRDPEAREYPSAIFDNPSATTPVARTLPKPIYVQAPTPPHEKGNRGFGILVSLISTVAFALIYGAIIAGITVLNGTPVNVVNGILLVAPFWVPVIVFFLASVISVAIINRSGWWAHVFAAFFVAIVTYGGYLAGALLDQVNNLQPGGVSEFIGNIWLTFPGIVAFVVAREVPVWFGAWIAAHGRKVTERNDQAQREYEQLLEHGPAL